MRELLLKKGEKIKIISKTGNFIIVVNIDDFILNRIDARRDEEK